MRFFNSEKLSGILILIFTLVSLAIANSTIGQPYSDFWHSLILGLTIEQWVNDGLMAIFFLFIGLELERELYNGELSNFRNALLPILAASGGIGLPALIHFYLNAGAPTQSGMGIPMATDIAFALGVLALLGHRVPASLKVFLTALAVIDDLGAIMVIAFFYTAELSLSYLFAAVGVFALLAVMNRTLRINSLMPFLIAGALMWFLMLKSGVHATVAGVLLALAIPYSSKLKGEDSPSHKLEHFLQKPVVFVILPVFTLANTGISIGANWVDELSSTNSLGILIGLVIGKPLGIAMFTAIALRLKISKLPSELNWKHIVGAGLLGGIGFTMSIFIANLAFVDDAGIMSSSKIAILFASLTAGILGFLWLRLCEHNSTSSL